MAILASALAIALTGLTSGGGAATPFIGPPGREYDQFALDVAADAGNGAVAGWTVGGTRPLAQVAVRGTGTGGFSSPVTLGPGRIARVAAGGGGRLAAAWLDDGVVRTARREPSGAWRRDRLPATLPRSGVTVTGLVVLPNGGAVLALESRSSDGWTVSVLRRGPAGSWRRAAHDLAVTDSSSGRLALDQAGRAVAVWLAARRGTPAAALLSATLEPGRTTWSPGTTVASARSGRTLAEPVLSVDASGGAAVLVSETGLTGEASGGRVATRPAGAAGWRISGTAPATSIAVTRDGTVWGAWPMRTGTSGIRPMAAPLRRGVWGPAQPAGPSGPVVGGPAVGVGASGAPAVWWLLDGGASADRWHASWRGPRGWPAPVRLGRTTGGLAVTTGGRRGLAVWVTAGPGGRPAAAPLR